MEPDDLAAIKLATEKHAIEIMAFAVEWRGVLSTDQLRAAYVAYDQNEELKASLPRYAQIKPLVINFGSAEAPAAQHDFSGMDFSRIRPDGGVEWSVSLRPNFFSCTCGSYDRWKNVKPKALSFLKPFLDVVCSTGAEIQGYGLQYSDTFRWSKAQPDAWKDLVRENSPLLPSILRDRPGIWHFNQGWVEPSGGDARVLNVLNMDVTDDPEMRTLRVNGQHRLQAVSMAGHMTESILMTTIDAAMDSLHEANKAALRSVLSDRLLNMIGLAKTQK